MPNKNLLLNRVNNIHDQETNNDNKEKRIKSLRSRILIEDHNTDTRLQYIKDLFSLDVQSCYDVIESCCHILSIIEGVIEQSKDENIVIEEERKFSNMASLIHKIIYIDAYDIRLRYNCAVTLFTHALLDEWISAFRFIADNKTVPDIYRIDACVYLVYNGSEESLSIAKSCIVEVLTNYTYESSYRFSVLCKFSMKDGALRSTMYSHKLKVKRNDEFIEPLFMDFVRDTNNGIEEIILGSQHILVYSTNTDYIADVNAILIGIARSGEMFHEHRSMAIDVIFNFSKDDVIKREAEDIFNSIRYEDVVIKTVYNDKENVHNSTISSTVRSLIKKLYRERKDSEIDVLNVFSQVTEYIHEHKYKPEDIDKVYKALNRITVDTALFTNPKRNITIGRILSMAWSKILESEHKKELQKRLVEEFIEMYNTCSSGYAARIINVFSGIDENYTINISFKDEIEAIVKQRVIKSMSSIEDEELREQIIDGMTFKTESEHLELYIDFITELFSVIKTELHKEYRDYLDKNEFEIIFKEITASYV